MSIVNKITVNTHYTRSVNLERDANVIAVTQNYIPTSRALRTFLRISETFSKQDMPRAWSWVGPYGSGKSSASAFLGQLLSNPNSEGYGVAQEVLSKASEQIAASFAQDHSQSNGWLKVFLTGSPESMGKRLIAALSKSMMEYASKNVISIKDSGKISDLLVKETLTTTEIVSAFQLLQESLVQHGCPGILIIIDELGKFLEYEARHYGANDIYLLQSLAEHAYKGQSVNLNLIVLLHQSFEQYAKGLGENLKNEWSKVQGRFEEVPFIESAEQVLRVVASAFQHNLNKTEQRALKTEVKKIVAAMSAQGALPTGLSVKEANTLFVSCYPLHPISATLLPILCQKVAQNERTLFSYLGSGEEFGMLDMLNKVKNTSEFINPYSIYDYFITNQASSIGDYLTHRRWAEVVTALERLNTENMLDVQTLKTIGLLNIIGSKGGFKPSGALLETMLDSPENSVIDSLERLEEKAVITYRKFSGEYRVWQGSDFDLEEALQVERSNLGKFALAAELNRSNTMLPIVARRYTIENGALRFFQPAFIDAVSFRTLEPVTNEPRILFYLGGDKEDEQIFEKEVCKYFSSLDVVTLCLNGTQLREAVAETQALRQVSEVRPEMHIDPVAKKEFDDRYTAAEVAEGELLSDLLYRPESARWFHNNTDLCVTSKRKLQEELSSLLERVYKESPRIHNELINRDRPSAQAVSARNKLLSAMLSSSDKQDLGIINYPPEKALYRSLLRKTGLHAFDKVTNIWRFQAPSALTSIGQDGSNLLPIWNEIEAFLESTESEERSFIDLNAKFKAAPFGVKAGVLPILYMAAYLVNKDELALFENRLYRPRFTQEMAERFIKAPSDFKVQRVRIDGMRSSIFDQYFDALIVGRNKGAATLLDLAQSLAIIFGDLPEYTLKTKRGLSRTAIEVRSVFQLAKSPEKLLLAQLPQALGYPSADQLTHDVDVLSGFSQDLSKVINELQQAHITLKNEQCRLLCLAFDLSPSLGVEELRKIILSKFKGLENFTVDTTGTRAFIMRLTKTIGDDLNWLESILMFLGHKPSGKWLDSDQDIAEARLANFAQRIIELEKLSIWKSKGQEEPSGEFNVHLLRSVKKSGEAFDKVVVIDEIISKKVESVVNTIEEDLKRLGNRDLAFAALAKVLDSHFNAIEVHTNIENVPNKSKLTEETS